MPALELSKNFEAFYCVQSVDVSEESTQSLEGENEDTLERVMGLEPTISCLGSKRSTTELHPRNRGIIASRKMDVNTRLSGLAAPNSQLLTDPV